jgi:hypothetical protein
MKRALFCLVLLAGAAAVFTGCIKNTPNNTTVNPSMTATIGSYRFVASSVVPSTLDTQVNDTTTMLIITGKTADRTTPLDKIILRVTKYNGNTAVFSIVQGQASAYYYHQGTTGQVYDTATGGVVSITHINQDNIVGYFSFTTNTGLSVANGSFTVGKPWNF